MSTLTARGQATRARIVDGAAAHIREHGVADTTLDDIRDRTSTSKSQLFHYFPGGKEELLLAVAAHESDRVLSDQQPHLSRLATWEDWQRWRDAVVRRYRAQGLRCPLAALNTELGRSSPAGRALSAQLFRRWAALLEDGLRTMQAAGHIRPALDPVRTAAALVAGIQGGVGILLATGDISTLEATLDLMLDHLRDATPTRPADRPRTPRKPVSDSLVEAEIIRLLQARADTSSICPSEVARSLGGDEHWRDLMEPVRTVAGRLAAAGRVRITQGASTVDIASCTGPVRIRRT